jgi:flagellar hook-associated protein 3 FlgL
MRSVQTRVDVYLSQNKLLADKLSTQDTALTRVADSAQAIRQAMADALASGRVDTLVEDIQAQMRNAVEAMNARYGGKYLFAGGQVDTRPVTATSLADLTAGPPISSFFQNDTFKVSAKLDEASTVTTGLLASDVGTDMLNALKDFETFNEGPDGPFTGQMTAAQKSFLEGQLASWDQIRADVTQVAAYNGANQKRLDTVAEDLQTRKDQLTGMLADITDADMAEAAAQLQQSQLAVQAAAYVFQSLQSSSLINLLK